LEAHFDGPSGPIAAALHTQTKPSLPFAQILSVHLRAQPVTQDGDDRFELDRLAGTDRVRIETRSQDRCRLARIVHVPEFDETRLLAGALETRRADPTYLRALPHLLWLLGS
jgi:hypothetical protein